MVCSGLIILINFLPILLICLLDYNLNSTRNYSYWNYWSHD